MRCVVLAGCRAPGTGAARVAVLNLRRHESHLSLCCLCGVGLFLALPARVARCL